MQVLLESLLGIGLFAAVVLLILVYLPTSDRAALVTDQLTQATQLARSLLDTNMDQSYNQINSYSGWVDIAHAERHGHDLVTRFSYDVSATVPATARLKDVVVKVNWQQGGRSGEVKLRGRKCDYW
ncbi:hypothetical protein ABS71_13410 [bacterium SCN 62-11]|nr:MAG: hypothetical protein ABS71_13410 [bacterium SCN 62-11]